MSQLEFVAKQGGPTVKRYQSEQDVETPADFLKAVSGRFGHIGFDLAATKENAKAFEFYTPEKDSLKQDWHLWPGPGIQWLNPRFGDIVPWASKCVLEKVKGARILMLTQASVCTNWWATYVHGIALVLLLRPRLKFVGHKHPFMKDLALCVFDNAVEPDYETWKWK